MILGQFGLGQSSLVFRPKLGCINSLGLGRTTGYKPGLIGLMRNEIQNNFISDLPSVVNVNNTK